MVKVYTNGKILTNRKAYAISTTPSSKLDFAINAVALIEVFLCGFVQLLYLSS